MRNQYLLGIPLGIAAFAATRGEDGSLKLFYASFTLVGIAYCSLVWDEFSSFRDAKLLHHLFVFELSIVPALVTAGLQEMSGMLLLFIPAAIVVIVAAAALIVGARKMLRR